MNRSYIKADELTLTEIGTLATHGTVVLDDGSAYTLWNQDASGAQWLRRVKAAAADADREYPEIHGQPETVKFIEGEFDDAE